ncbi:hypothetical protein ACMFMG_000913 [Clarireedia jacksonii]
MITSYHVFAATIKGLEYISVIIHGLRAMNHTSHTRRTLPSLGASLRGTYRLSDMWSSDAYQFDGGTTRYSVKFDFMDSARELKLEFHCQGLLSPALVWLVGAIDLISYCCS